MLLDTDKKDVKNMIYTVIQKYIRKIPNINIANKSIFFKNISSSFTHKINNISDSYNTLTIFKKSSILFLFNSSSSSIIKHPNDENLFIINTRFTNYILNKIGQNSNSGVKTMCITINRIATMDKSFNTMSFKYLLPRSYSSKYVGIEDIRLFNFNKEIYFIGSLYNPLNNKIEIVSNKYSIGNNYNPLIINPSFKTDYVWEKNWVFFNNNNELNIIYKWYPIYICKIDYTKQTLNLIKTIDNLPCDFKQFRGSTNGIEYDNKIWFIVHQQNNIISGVKNSYEHNFVVFDKNMNLLGYSNIFKFENSIVEFCIGMELSCDNNFIISYSVLDCSSKIVVFSPEYINSLIKYI